VSTTIRETEAPQIIPVEVEEAARRGAALLDEKHPGWADKIDTKRLNIAHPCHCILGQLGWDTVRFTSTSSYSSHGFLRSKSREEYLNLTPAWLVEIMERRS
jgi:hypothetical protein